VTATAAAAAVGDHGAPTIPAAAGGGPVPRQAEDGEGEEVDSGGGVHFRFAHGILSYLLIFFKKC
jgi:hypothetical protein